MNKGFFKKNCRNCTDKGVIPTMDDSPKEKRTIETNKDIHDDPVVSATNVVDGDCDGLEVLGIPQNLTASTTSLLQITVSWDAVDGATGYEIFRDDVFLDITANTQYVDDTVVDFDDHVYAVRAIKYYREWPPE